MNYCAVCGGATAEADIFCGSCGARIDHGTRAEASPQGNPGIGHALDGQWAGFELSQEPNGVSADAATVIDEAFTGHGSSPLSQGVHYCTVRYSDYVGVAADTAYEGKTSALIGASIYRAAATVGRALGPHGDFDVDASHYAFRVAEWGRGELGVIGISTYIAALFSTHGRGALGGRQVEVHTLPPSPIANTIFAVLPGACPGHAVMSRESGAFVTKEAALRGSWLTERLNDSVVTRDVTELLAHDHDAVGDVTYQREYLVPTQGVAKRPLGPRRGTDPYFLPTLFESAEYDYRGWPGYQASPSRRLGRGPGSAYIRRGMESSMMTTRDFDPAKYFAVVLLPFAERTLVTLTWPTPSRFDARGHLMSVEFSFALVDRVLGHLKRVLADPRAGGSSAPSALAYWDYANRATHYRGGKSRQFNFAIPPLEWVLGSLPAR